MKKKTIVKIGQTEGFFYTPKYSKGRKHTRRKFPCWKIQYYEEISCCWKDVPKQYHDRTVAEEAAKTLKKNRVRLLQIDSDKEIKPLEEIRGKSNDCGPKNSI